MTTGKTNRIDFVIGHFVVVTMPLIIKHLVSDQEYSVLTLGLLLHEIVERLTAQEFFSHEIDIVEEKIVQYLELRKNIRLAYPNLMPSPKPKHHFLRRIH